MIKFKQVLTDDDYIKAGIAGFKRNVMMRILFILSILLVVVGFFLILVSIPLFISGEYVYTICGVFKKKIYLKRLLNIVRSNKNYGSEMFIKIDDDGMIELSRGSDKNLSELKNYYGYAVTDDAILLYPQKNLFMILKKEMLGENWDIALDYLISTNLKRIF
jgi:hypothetical protein